MLSNWFRNVPDKSIILTCLCHEYSLKIKINVKLGFDPSPKIAVTYNKLTN